MAFPFFRQLDHKDCGATCLRIISKFYGRNVSIEVLRDLTETTREGTSLKGLADAAEKIGFRTLPAQVTWNQLREEAPLPGIAYWNQNHFVVIYKIRKDRIYISDPGHGLLEYNKKDFLARWIGEEANEESEGIVLLLEPTADFSKEDELDVQDKGNLGFLLKYVSRYKKFIVQLFLGVIAASLIQLLLPFLAKSLVDVGIQNRDLDFVYLILLAQLFLFLGKTSVEILRGWILLHLSARISISLISDFFIKLMKLPIGYFDSKVTGDIIQRIRDHHKIETFLTSSSLNTVFSITNLFIFSIVLCFFSLKIFFLFFTGSVLYVVWILVFLKKRETLDYKMFSQLAQEQDKVYELITGMQEIKLGNSETQKRWSWEHLQARLFKIQLKGLALDQTQTVGASLINELKNILISFYAVTLVMNGELTLGMMLAISYILGQLNSPLLDLVRFIHSAQDAKIALARLSEIHNRPDEEDHGSKSNIIPEGDLLLEDVTFRYPGALSPIIQGINLRIPRNQITAIVGPSGSGKTTLLKLILKFYKLNAGEILIGNQNLKNISVQKWREACGVVMQDGFIFNDSIANNIALGEEKVDNERLKQAVEIANIRNLIDSLPLGYNTKIGSNGLNLSFGERQRVLIARAVYKNPDFVFFDEATSALDTTNESSIMKNINQFLKNKTSVIIAHRLSTVKNADQIIVLDNGRIAEMGNHYSLILQKGIYYNLVKDQLEVENLS
jgi:ATP-binding cassette, subfamily B, bacterial